MNFFSTLPVETRVSFIQLLQVSATGPWWPSCFIWEQW